MIKLRMVGHVARNTFRTLIGKPEVGRPRVEARGRLEDILKCSTVLEKWSVRLWTEFIWHRTGSGDWLL